MNRKSNVLQLFFVLGTITAFIFISVFSLKILNSFGTAFTSVGDATSIVNLESGISSFGMLDSIIPIIIILLFIIFIISAFYVRTNPVFFFVSLFLLTIVVISSASFSNIIGALGQVEALDSETTTFSNTFDIATKLPTFVTIAGFLFLLVMYGLWRNKSSE